MLSKEERIKNLKQANDKSHKIADKALKDALYKMLKTKNIADIKITDLIKSAGVSRGTYYKHYYLLTDLLIDDLDEIVDSVLNNLTSSLYSNWLIIFNKTYEYKDKLVLIYKAGLSMEFLEKLNNHFKGKENEKTYIILNGIAFNTIYYWGKNGFDKSPEKLAEEITKITKPIIRINYVKNKEIKK